MYPTQKNAQLSVMPGARIQVLMLALRRFSFRAGIWPFLTRPSRK
jgi:hypothetical protein